MPTTETSSALIERALDTYDALAARHRRRVRIEPETADLIEARRQLLSARTWSEEWNVPLPSAVAVDRLIAGAEAIESVELEADALDRFPLDVLDALDRRTSGRRDRDREAETIAFTFA